jgi:fumarate hydratase class II
MSGPPTRTERDALGPVEVPADRYWGAQTQRALEHFRIGTERMPLELIHALGLVKKACADVNAELGLLPAAIAPSLAAAAEEVARGALDEHFPLPVWQSGSGTQTNMNANEVIANRAIERLGGRLGSKHPVHPNDHVNLSQSSNDVIPTAMHVAAVEALRGRLLPALAGLRETLAARAAAFADVVKVGRTHGQDATPVTLGQELSGWVAMLERAEAGVEAAQPGLCELAIGGTAVGTGVNAPPGFGDRVAARLAALTGRPFLSAPNKFQALASHEGLLAAHGALRTLAAALLKIANDLRWLASGPRAGLGEITIPANEPGSSIMPGKVNPTQAEALAMVCMQVLANDVAVGLGGGSGQLELNVARPLLARNALESIRLLADAMTSFTRHCAAGIEPDRVRMRELVERSLMLVTALVPRIGYDRAAEIALTAHRQGVTLREAALALGYVTAEEFDRLVRPEALLGPGAGPAGGGWRPAGGPA